jgi:hypothetical protein
VEAETGNTQAKGNKVTLDESRCFALTSIELFGGTLQLRELISCWRAKLSPVGPASMITTLVLIFVFICSILISRT